LDLTKEVRGNEPGTGDKESPAEIGREKERAIGAGARDGGATRRRGRKEGGRRRPAERRTRRRGRNEAGRDGRKGVDGGTEEEGGGKVKEKAGKAKE